MLDESIKPGTIWETQSPTGELLLFLIVELFGRTGAVGELPFDFVRGVPVTDHLQLVTNGDVVILTTQGPSRLMLAHVSLEGPIMSTSLLKLVNQVDSECLRDALRARNLRGTHRGGSERASSVVSEFRDTLLEQFGPVYSEWCSRIAIA